MKILSSIKSMQPIAVEEKKSAPSLFEAGKTISKVVNEYIVKKKAEASDTLRAILSNPENGELLDATTTINAGDIIVVAPQPFRVGTVTEDKEYITLNPHGMIVIVTNTWPVTFDIYEMALYPRDVHTIYLGQPAKTRHPKVNMNYIISPQITNAKIAKYVEKHIAQGCGFRIKVSAQDIYIGAVYAADNAEKTRQKMSKFESSTAAAYYGNTNCNNYVHDIVVKALEVRNNNSHAGS